MGMLALHRRALTAFGAGLIGILAIGLAASVAGAGKADRLTKVSGTIWAANRGAHTIRGFDAATGSVVSTVAMRDGSQPGDVAYARGRLYVAEEFGTPPAIAIVDPDTGVVEKRIELAPGSRPHHVHRTARGDLVAFGLYGTDNVAVVDTTTESLLGPWDTDPGSTSGRDHAGVFSRDGKTLYVASDASNQVIALEPRTGEVLWRMDVPGAHELAVSRDGKTAFVTRRTLNRVSVIDLKQRTYTDVLTLGLPDTMQLAAGGKLLTIGLRTTRPRWQWSTRGRSSTSSSGSGRCSTRPPLPVISGRRRTAVSRSRPTKAGRIRASRSSTTGRKTQSWARCPIPVARTASTSLQGRLTTIPSWAERTTDRQALGAGGLGARAISSRPGPDREGGPACRPI